MDNTRLMIIHALSPLHPGTGQSVADIDLPIAREKATGLPYLPGSSVKGVLRDACTNETSRKFLFGPDSSEASLFAGLLQFTDLHVLLMPIRSLAGTFAWVTSPYVLRRLMREAVETQHSTLQPPTIASVDQCLVASNSAISFRRQGDQPLVCLEDLVLNDVQPSADAYAEFLGQLCFESQGWRDFLRERLCIIHDDVFAFLLKTATEITARIRMNEETKTVADQGLWYEEALPAETILCGMVVATPRSEHMRNHYDATRGFTELSSLTKSALQFGGNASVGRGLCYVSLVAADGGTNAHA